MFQDKDNTLPLISMLHLASKGGGVLYILTSIWVMRTPNAGWNIYCFFVLCDDVNINYVILMKCKHKIMQFNLLSQKRDKKVCLNIASLIHAFYFNFLIDKSRLLKRNKTLLLLLLYYHLLYFLYHRLWNWLQICLVFLENYLTLS